ncbi:MAG: hypothetical protein WAQ98_21105 [Blastocatellia bacterium]
MAIVFVLNLMVNILLNQFFHQQPWLKRGLVIFFLLFMLFDIVFPENCVEEDLVNNNKDTELSFHLNNQNNQFYNESKLTFTKSDREYSITVDCSHHTHQKPSKQSNDDCCFCCCSHWLPAKTVKVERTPIDLSLNNSVNLGFLPEPPSQATFHPPKHS